MQETKTWHETAQSLFPDSRKMTKEESEGYSRMIQKRGVVEEKLFENHTKPVTPWVPRDWGAC